MKNMKKAFVIFLTIFGLTAVSCGDGTENPVDSNQNATANQSDNGEFEHMPEAHAEKIMPDIPDNADFNGYEFKILANGADMGHWASRDIYVESETGDTIDDAVYYRNRAIEEKYNIKIKGVFSNNGSQSADARKSIASSDDAYDVFTIPIMTHTTQLALDGMLLDLKNVPYIDLEKPWWDQKANAQLSIGNRLFFTIGDLLVIDKDALSVFLFNKDVIEANALDDPYKLVREGKWTADKMWDMARGIAKDLNGDGSMDEDDCYGIMSQTHTIHGNIVGSGHLFFTKDGDDMPVLNATEPMIQAAYEKWINMLNDRTNTMVAQDYYAKYGGDIWDKQLQILEEKRSLFLYTFMNRVTMLRSSECNFGILPNPKYDEAQGEYYNAVHVGLTTGVSVPITSEPERTGMILEALTAESYYSLKPAYYDISLQGKLLRDDESSEMLDLIFATRCYDLGYVYMWGELIWKIEELAEKKSIAFVSELEKLLPRTEEEMQKTIEVFSALK